jgi:hypothetical protein
VRECGLGRANRAATVAALTMPCRAGEPGEPQLARALARARRMSALIGLPKRSGNAPVGPKRATDLTIPSAPQFLAREVSYLTGWCRLSCR